MNFKELCKKYDVVSPWSGIGDGWVPSLEECFKKLIAADWDRQAGQIKEKFGTGRFYGIFTPGQQEIVDNWERATHHICETCGQPGEYCCVGGWYGTQCKRCFDNWRKDRVPDDDPEGNDWTWWGVEEGLDNGKLVPGEESDNEGR